MTALTTGTGTSWKGNAARTFTRACSLILAGAVIPRGSLAMAHNDRAMPAGILDKTKTVAQGGMFKVAGGDANGDLYFYGKLPNVTLTIANGAALGIKGDGGTGITITIVSGITTANAVIDAIQAHAQASMLIGFDRGGTGASTAGVQSGTAIPHVRLLGISDFDLDNSGNPSTDVAIPINKSEFRYGKAYLINDTGGTPLTQSDCPGVGWVLDNATISKQKTVYSQLPISVDELATRGQEAGLVCVTIS